MLLDPLVVEKIERGVSTFYSQPYMNTNPQYHSTMKLLLSTWAIALWLEAGILASPVPPSNSTPPVPLPTNAALPNWPKPAYPQLPPDAPAVISEDLALRHSPAVFGAFVVQVGGQPFAIGQERPMLAYLAAGQLHWLDLANAANKTFSLRRQGSGLRSKLEATDAEGARWTMEQRFRPGRMPGSIDVDTDLTVDQDRQVAFAPLLVVFPGVGSFGQKKGQGLLAGLEYLEDEPSSSEADVIGPASKRQVPDSLKLVFPLMAIQHNDRYLGLIWQMQPHFSALFDSPDRFFSSGGHVMGVLYPGSNGKNRQEGSLLPRYAETLHARQPLALHATLVGGLGRSIVPAVQQYVSLRGLPPVPKTLQLPQYVALTAGGWLDSQLRHTNLFRHAVAGNNFPPGHAADAAVMMDWLALHTADTALAARLKNTAGVALTGIPPADWNFSGVGHVRYPLASLLYGHTTEAAARAREHGLGLLRSFQPDGSVHYHPNPNGPDYAKTSATNEATGFTSRPVMDLLEAAAFSGDRNLIETALKELRAMDKFRNGVPRGAQTWECPLHIPDILASAQMVRAYALGYELTGDPDFLEQARYWAWTGVPFVYLVNPTDKPTGLYATIAVFGATNWKAPIWLGLPVQWCGMVYADALYRLVRHDPQGPWKKLADGITASGIQQTYPSTDAAMQGLLPDSFVLRAQHRNPPAINPATVQVSAVRYFGQTPLYDFWCFRENGVRLHVPGEIASPREKPGRISFQIKPWSNGSYYILLNGYAKKPQLKVNGRKTDCSAPHEYLDKEGCLLLKLEGKAHVELVL